MKAKSLYEDSADSRESAKLRDFAGISPFWLAPVHWHGRNVNEHSEIREALGWDKLQESLATVLSALFVVGLMLMMMRVAYVGYLITDDHARLRKLLNLSVDSGAFTWMVMVDVFLALFLILTVIGCFAWFFGWTFMTGTLGIAIGNRSFSRRRRALVGTVITAVPLLIAVALARTIKWPQDQTDTGEGRSYTEHDLARGFYKNVLESIAPGNNASKGGAVHYIDGEGRSRTLVGRQLGKSAGPPRLEWVKNEADIVRNLVFQDFTYAVELNVLEAIRSGDEEQILQARKILNEACEFQLGGELKKGARPHISFRLLDMMVRIYSMGGQVEEIRALGGRAMRLASGSEQLRTIDRKRLRTRAELWTKEAIYEEAGDHSGWAFYVKERRLHIDLTDAIS